MQDEYQAETMADLITPLQLQRIFCAATAVSLDAFYVSEQMFNCPIGELSQQAAGELLDYFETIKATEDEWPLMSRLAREQRRREQQQAILIKPQPRSMGRLDGMEI